MNDVTIPTTTHTSSREPAPANLPTTMNVSCCRFKSCGLTDVHLARENGSLVYLRGSNDEWYASGSADELRERIVAGEFWSVTNVEVDESGIRCDAYVSTNSSITFRGGEIVEHTETPVEGDAEDKREIVDAFATAVGIVRGRTYRFESVGRATVRDDDWDDEMYRFTYVSGDVKVLGPEITSQMGHRILAGPQDTNEKGN